MGRENATSSSKIWRKSDIRRNLQRLAIILRDIGSTPQISLFNPSVRSIGRLWCSWYHSIRNECRKLTRSMSQNRLVARKRGICRISTLFESQTRIKPYQSFYLDHGWSLVRWFERNSSDETKTATLHVEK